MMRILIAGILAFGLMVGSAAEVKANGSAGFGIGIGLNFTFSKAGNCQGGGCGGCLPPPGWSPYYPCPTPYGGLFNYNPYLYYPSYGSFPYAGGFDGGTGFQGIAPVAPGHNIAPAQNLAPPVAAPAPANNLPKK